MLLRQIQNLRKRIQIIKHMQTLGVLSLIFCVVSMRLIFFGRQTGGQVAFGVSLVLMLGLLTLSLVEIQMSAHGAEHAVARCEVPGGVAGCARFRGSIRRCGS